MNLRKTSVGSRQFGKVWGPYIYWRCNSTYVWTLFAHDQVKP